MADEGAPSSSDSIDEGKTRQENQPSHFVSIFLLGKESGNAASNPFAIKTSTPARSVADSTDSKESRPLLAPPTLKLGSSEAPKVVLRPSALSVQAEKLKLMNQHDSSSKQEGKENSSHESNVAKVARLDSSESNGKDSKIDFIGTNFFASVSESSMSSTSKTSSVAECSISFEGKNSDDKSFKKQAEASMSSPSKTSSVAECSFSFVGKNSDDKSSNGTFIFGQNLHERALNYDTHSEQPLSPADSHNLTFEEAALKKEELEKMERQNQEEKLKKSLSESAKEYESKQVKRKFDEVTVITGEEEESNVMQINCKLFAFDKVNMNWQERGRGILRLNDKEFKGNLHSRVVMRTHGSLRVVLNTKVWAGMTVEHPSKKTVRLTAYDPQGVKVFLVTAQPKDAEQLFHALDWRVATLKAQDTSAKQPLRNSENQSTIEEATSSSNLPDASCDDSCDISNQGNPSSESICYGADSSSETNFKPRDSSGDAIVEGAADSTDIQS